MQHSSVALKHFTSCCNDSHTVKRHVTDSMKSWAPKKGFNRIVNHVITVSEMSDGYTQRKVFLNYPSSFLSVYINLYMPPHRLSVLMFWIHELVCDLGFFPSATCLIFTPWWNNCVVFWRRRYILAAHADNWDETVPRLKSNQGIQSSLRVMMVVQNAGTERGQLW